MKRFFKYLLYRFRFDHPLFLNPRRRPVHLHLELNATCNSKCEFCYRQAPSWQGTKKTIAGRPAITFEKISSWLQQAYDCGCRSVKFNWRGEPSISPDLNYAVSEARRIGYVDILLNTNGQKQFENYTLENVNHISYSVDASDPVEYEKLRVGCSWQKLLDNIAEAMGSSRAVFTIQRASNDDKHVVWETALRNVLKLAIYYRNFSNPARGLLALIALDNAKFSTRPLEDRIKNKYLFTSETLRQRFAEIKQGEPPYCRESSRAITVGFDGQVWACPHAYNEPGELLFGDLTIGSLQSMLFSKKRKLFIRDTYNNAPEYFPRSCIMCPSKTTRGAGC